MITGLKQEAALAGDSLQRCGILSVYEEGCRSARLGTTIVHVGITSSSVG